MPSRPGRIENRVGVVLFEDKSLTMRGTLEAAVATNTDLTAADLYGQPLVGLDLTGKPPAKLTKANLYGANICDGKLGGGDFTGSDMTGACFKMADVSNCKFDHAVLVGANGRGVTSTGLTYSGAMTQGSYGDWPWITP